MKNEIPELKIEIELNSDGSADITQEFYAVVEEGTEMYLYYFNNEYLEITDFQVSDEDGTYEVLEDEWNTYSSFEDKAGKCGMISNIGRDDMCWGITEYGEKQYTVTYTLHDLVSAYEEADGFNYRFVSPGFDGRPTNVELTIRNSDGSAITDEETDIWAFGYDGQIELIDGEIRAWSETDLGEENHMTIMVEFEKGIYTPEHTMEKSFASVKEEAFADSTYQNMDRFDTLGLVLTVFCGIMGPIVVIAIGWWLWNKIRRNNREKKVAYFRELPNDGDLNASYILGCKTGYLKEEGLFGAHILRLLGTGTLEMMPTAIESEEMPLRLVREPATGDTCDNKLYEMLKVAADGDGVVELRRFESYYQDIDKGKTLSAFGYYCERQGMEVLRKGDCLKDGVTCESTRDLTKTGNARLDELLGFRRYLQDFTLLQEREMVSAVMWQDYMAYAVLLGIAEPAMDQFKEVCLGQLPDFERYNKYVRWAMRWERCLYLPMQTYRERQALERKYGGGGYASRGGGGGFSGGGGGGFR